MYAFGHAEMNGMHTLSLCLFLLFLYLLQQTFTPVSRVAYVCIRFVCVCALSFFENIDC